jgi:hypothetical protein
MRARSYSTFQGRFTSEDPLDLAGGQTNLYIYGKNDPITRIDPTGTFAQIIFGAGIGAVIGALGGAAGYLAGHAAGDMISAGQQPFSWSDLVGAAVGGAASGAVIGGLAASGVGLIAIAPELGAGLGALSGFVSTGVSQWLNGQFNTTQLLVNTLVGAGIGWFGAPGQLYGGFRAPFYTAYGSIFGLITNVAASLSTNLIDTVAAKDPNALYGPAGYGQSNFVAANTVFPYRIDFENAATATAPAQSELIKSSVVSRPPP